VFIATSFALELARAWRCLPGPQRCETPWYADPQEADRAPGGGAGHDARVRGGGQARNDRWCDPWGARDLDRLPDG